MGVSMDGSALEMHMVYWLFSINGIIGNNDKVKGDKRLL
jgi:hypothetical protein